MRASVLGVLRGLLLLARFDAAGFGHLGGGAQDVLASLAPLLAFPLVFGVTAMLGDGDPHELAALLAAIAVLLLPLVTSEALARRWQCDPAWGRFAVAFNWSQWTMTLVAVAVFVLAGLLAASGLPQRPVAGAALLTVVGYQLGLHWFLARRGLQVSAARAALLVLVMDLSSTALLAMFLLLEASAERGAA
jgi:hypothetical protein